MSKTDLSSFNNSWYHPGASVIVRGLWYLINCIFVNSYFPFSRLKVFILRSFGSRIGKNARIKPCVNIKYPWNLTIGDNVWIGERTWIDNLGKVVIGSNVCISQGASIMTGNHNYTKTSFDLMTGDVVLEDGVWIGAFSVVCPKVVCHSHAVLAVGSVATSDLDPFSVYQGNPAVKIRERIIK